MESISKIEIKTKANLGKRITGGFIDYSIVILFQGSMFYFFGERIGSTYILSGTPFYMVILFWIIMTIGMEQIFGATIGNYLSDIKPISIDGFENQRVSLGQSVKRHLLDIIDLFLFGLLGILLIKNTEHHQRLGDIWAKTIVIDTSDKEQGIKL